MAKLSIIPATANAVNASETKINDTLAEGVTSSVNLSPLVQPMNGYMSGDLESADRDSIKGQYMSIFASYAASLRGSWVNISLDNDWTNVGDNMCYVAQYKCDGLGNVMLRGNICKPTSLVAPSVIYTLPSGCRPSKTYTILIGCWNLSGPSTGQMVILPNGNIMITHGLFVLGQTWYSLDGISFGVD